MTLIRKNLFIAATMLLLSCTTKLVPPNPTITHYKPAYTLLAEQHIATLNERDIYRRSEIFEAIYNEDVPYEDLGEEYDSLHRQYPKSKFSIVEPVNFENSMVRVKWKLGKPGRPAHSTGENILFLKDEKIKSLYVYVDPNEGGHSFLPKRASVPKIL
jgi:hypothetical protein